ncbi:hypothetical protein [Rossellomorea aquimaris]|uniref:Uncharacterized protein n=1 Tax=Rossellomorea aquimaris TaxID=189382 RepID=A0A366ELZ2_9BACI|nr:hypothetical protein [Rossellomorea aquimaris]RBP02499.1 hypothetical protein DET59_11462 [Rossellomorea aquimaris]
MLLTLPTIIVFIKYLLIAILLTQLGYGFLILLLGKTMVDFYTISIYEKPNNSFQKATNFFQKSTIGFGYFIYTKVSKFNWIVSKFLLLVCLIIQAILSILIYELIFGLLKWLFL